MLTIMAYIGLALLLVVLAIFAIAARRPDVFRVWRSMHIAATPDRLFPLIEDLRAMNTWNPYALRETSGDTGYSGPPSGKGARFEFAGKKSGTGWIEIKDARRPCEVVMNLVMTKPFQADNIVTFSLVPDDTGTMVSWAMSGRQPILAKAMTLFVDCDKMVGRDFDEGLANLKRLAEVR